MEEIDRKLEGEQGATDGLEGTSPSGEAGVQLSSAPTPTAEEMEDAGIPQADNPEPAQGVADAQEAQADGDGLAPAAEEVGQGEEPQPAEPAERTFTQSQVNDLVGRTRMETREQTYRAVYGRYGVEDEAGMDELVGNAQRYETVRGEYDEARKGWETSDKAKSAELSEIKEHVALLESGIDKSRFEDAKAIIRSKGLEVTVDSIKNELATHPEWMGGAQAQAEASPNFQKDPSAQPAPISPEPESTIKVLGNEGDPRSDGMSEEEYAMTHLFKI